jgi:hypothetical protein
LAALRRQMTINNISGAAPAIETPPFALQQYVDETGCCSFFFASQLKRRRQYYYYYFS